MIDLRFTPGLPPGRRTRSAKRVAPNSMSSSPLTAPSAFPARVLKSPHQMIQTAKVRGRSTKIISTFLDQTDESLFSLSTRVCAPVLAPFSPRHVLGYSNAVLKCFGRICATQSSS